jgi:glycosyltransferase involved in cell wall biosynthesis
MPIEVKWVHTPDWLTRLLPGKVLGMANYCLWHLRAAQVLRRHERSFEVDAVHHVTWASDSLPSALIASRAPVRIWGPVGGSTRTPLGLYRYLTVRGRLGEVIRDVMNGSFRRTTGWWSARRATLVVALNEDVARRWRRGRTPVVVESNIALDRVQLDEASSHPPDLRAGGYRVALFVGRLIPWKGLLLAVESLRFAPDWKLVIFGEGPDRKAAEGLAESLGVRDRLDFRGYVPRNDVLGAFRAADALFFPSFHDSAGWAVGEASSLGCPVICLDAGGPALQAGDNGYVVPIRPESSLAERLGVRLRDLPLRGAPALHLESDRLQAVLHDWYSGVVPPECAQAPGAYLADSGRRRAG